MLVNGGPLGVAGGRHPPYFCDCSRPFDGRLSRTSRWKLTSSSLFAKRELSRPAPAVACRALLIVPPTVSGATPTLKAPFDARFSRTSRWKLMSSSLFARRDCRQLSLGSWASRFAHRSSDHQRRDSDAQSAEAARDFPMLAISGPRLHSLRWNSGRAGLTRSRSQPCSSWSCSEQAERTQLGGRRRRAYDGAGSLASWPNRGSPACSRQSPAGERQW